MRSTRHAPSVRRCPPVVVVLEEVGAFTRDGDELVVDYLVALRLLGDSLRLLFGVHSHVLHRQKVLANSRHHAKGILSPTKKVSSWEGHAM